MAQIVMFPQPFLDLATEIKLHHPKLQQLIANHPLDELELRMAEISTYCDVILDGTYTPEDMIRLAETLCRKLEKKRSSIILLN